MLLIFILCIGVCWGANCPYETNIIRPCPDLNPHCVQDYFAKHHGCKPVQCTSDPYTIKDLVMPLPYGNMTCIWRNNQYHGLQNARILEFYINRNTNKLVIEIEFDEVKVYSPESCIKYYFKGREPVVLQGHSGISYGMLSLTITVPINCEGKILWAEKDVYPYFGVDSFPIDIDEQNLCFKNPAVLHHFEDVMRNKAVAMREAFVIAAPRIFDLYFSRNICQF